MSTITDCSFYLLFSASKIFLMQTGLKGLVKKTESSPIEQY